MKSTTMRQKLISDTNKQRLVAVSNFLREYRINNGLRQEDIASDSIHRNTISRAETGKNITLISLFEIADSLEIDLADLLCDID
jgi:transcriptional regulator with XRE-family HTH domain